MKSWPILALGAAVALAVPVVAHMAKIIQLLNIAILNAIVVLGLNFVTGWAGQINFGQAAFYGLGAYTTARNQSRPAMDRGTLLVCHRRGCRQPCSACRPCACAPTIWQ
jgi:ABC-type branched-subunit amino acid transport system permease subunit